MAVAAGFVSLCGETSCQRTFVATIRLKSDSQARDSFILAALLFLFLLLLLFLLMLSL